MNAKTVAERRVARQKQHRAKTGGLEPRQHGAHERLVVDSRTKQIQRSDALLEALAKRTDEIFSREMIEAAVDPSLPPDVIRFGEDTIVELAHRNECPKCGAIGDNFCRTPSGRVAEKPHKDRVTT